MTATQSSDMGRIYKRCSKEMQGNLFSVPQPILTHTHTHTHPPPNTQHIPNHKHQPAVSVTVRCVYLHLERTGWHDNLAQLR